MRNTVENLNLLEDGLESLCDDPVLVDVQARFVVVDQKTLDAVGAELVPNNAPDHRYDIADFEDVPAEVLERRLIARHDLLLNAAPKVLTQQGYEALLKSVTEYIYPTDYQVLMGEYVGGPTNEPVRVKSSGIATVEPQAFMMREVGTILRVTPTLADETSLIDLELEVQFVGEPEWSDYGMDLPSPNGGDYAIPIKQPFFPTRAINTRLTVSPGATILAGSLVLTKKNDATQFVFLRVRIVDTHGRPIKDEQKYRDLIMGTDPVH